MATQYTDILKLALPTQGELAGTWGTVVNNQLTKMVEEAIAGLTTIDSWTTNSHTMNVVEGATSESRAAIVKLTDTGAALTGTATLVCPAASKVYIVHNKTSYSVIVKTSGGTGQTIPAGKNALLFCDGTNVENATTYLPYDNSSSGLTATNVNDALDELDTALADAESVIGGLGTAATEDVQTSATDTTAGRLMTVGAFGLGSLSGVALSTITSNIDATNIPVGFYRIDTNVSSGTKPSTYGVLIQGHYTATENSQLFISNTNEVYTRYYTSSWTAWKRVLQLGDYGIGTTTAIGAVVDLDDAPVGAFFSAANTAANNPVGVGVVGWTSGYQSDRLVQTAIDISTSDTYVRTLVGTTWSAWQRQLNSSDVQSNDYDNTDGRLLTVGAFGLGAPDLQAFSGLDANNLGATGIYYTSNPVNAAVATTSIFVTMESSAGGGRTRQMQFPVNSTDIYTRAEVDGVWGAWTRLLNANDAQTSAYDSAAGKLLTNGSWGIGSTSALVLSSAGYNLDDTNIPAGFWRVTSASTGTFPTGYAAGGELIVMRHNATENLQIFIGTDGTEFKRFYSSGGAAWTAWEKVINEGDVQSSFVDATAGRLLKVGAFGLGGITAFLTSQDLNTITNGGGFYYCINCTNRPTSDNGYMLVMRNDANNAMQWYYVYGTGSLIYFRQSVAGVWTGWRKFLGDNDKAATAYSNGLMSNGAFGLGGDTGLYSGSLNDFAVTQFITCSSSSTARPTGSSSGELLHIQSDVSTNATQIFQDNLGDLYARKKSGGVWGSWRKMWDSADQQSNLYDSTVGKLLTTGSFGLGGYGGVTTDFNSGVITGFYATSGTASNRPSGAGAGDLVHIATDGSNATQIFADVSSQTMYWRKKVGGTWQAWNSLLDSADVQASDYDTTDGKLLTVGSFGLGGLTTSYTGNLNSLTYSTFITANSSATNKPSANSGWVLHVTGTATNSAAQVYIDTNGDTFTRKQVSGTWSAWRKLHDSSTINAGKITVSASAPSSPSTNDIWIEP